ncbi:MAG: hypothetical protein HOA57_01590 [Candidatus Magasanikbacteria bacterium]|nr:hypothetical protein [Candidatus Magasanikbacteria bacterium]MBT4315194.1 hypothetical protein [Candidatus Magasanikbacteria bacterium]MBT4547349.1 hypothetical protein [Candidatus Magasanikbacteria bacterium]MBT6819049.1 hypothetical protein [Candidatus Magasanikbacteria bacterium]
MKRGTFEGEDFVWVNKGDDPRHVLSWSGYAISDGVINYRLEDVDTDPKTPPRSCSVADFSTVLRIHFGKLKL